MNLVPCSFNSWMVGLPADLEWTFLTVGNDTGLRLTLWLQEGRWQAMAFLFHQSQYNLHGYLLGIYHDCQSRQGPQSRPLKQTAQAAFKQPQQPGGYRDSQWEVQSLGQLRLPNQHLPLDVFGPLLAHKPGSKIEPHLGNVFLLFKNSL